MHAYIFCTASIISTMNHYTSTRSFFRPANDIQHQLYQFRLSFGRVWNITDRIFPKCVKVGIPWNRTAYFLTYMIIRLYIHCMLHTNVPDLFEHVGVFEGHILAYAHRRAQKFHSGRDGHGHVVLAVATSIAWRHFADGVTTLESPSD